MFFPIIMKDDYIGKPVVSESFENTSPKEIIKLDKSALKLGVLEVPKIKHLLNHSIGIYGGSKCGKTTMIDNFIKGLVADMDEVYVFSGTEKSNLNYSRFLPSAPFITDNLTNEALEAIVDRQEMKDSLYYSIHDFVQVKAILQEYSDVIYDALEGNIKQFIDLDEKANYEKAKAGVKRRLTHYLTLPKMELIRLASAVPFYHDMTIKDFVSSCVKPDKRIPIEEFILYLYVTPVIKWIRKNLPAAFSLSDECNESESKRMFKAIILFWELRRNTMIIIDDLTAQIQALASKKGNSCLNTILTAGRHKNITLIMIMHNPSVLNVTTRLSVMVSVFCDNASAKGFYHNEKDKKDELIGFKYAMGGKMYDGPNDSIRRTQTVSPTSFRCIPIVFSDGGLADKGDGYDRYMYIRSYIVNPRDILAITQSRFDYLFSISKQLETKLTETAKKKALKSL